MTDKLYEMFKQRYPEEHNIISLYEDYERIYLNLNDRCFLDNQGEDLISLGEIETLCDNYFNGFYTLIFGKDLSSSDSGLYIPFHFGSNPFFLINKNMVGIRLN